MRPSSRVQQTGPPRWLLFPVFFHYHRIINLWAPPRKRQWSWTQITWRRRRQWKTLMERHPQTIFVSGFNARTLALTVTPDMSIEDVHRALQSRGALPNWAPWQRPYYFAISGRRLTSLAWNDTIDALNLPALSTLQLRAPILDRSSNSGSASASASAAGNALPVAGPSGTRTSTQERNTKHRKHQRKHKGSRNTPIDITDASDEDFSGDEGSGQSGSESSDEGAQLSNGEVADSLPSMTNISSAAKGAGKAKAPATRKPCKKRQRKQATAVDNDELPIPAATSSQTRSAETKKDKCSGRHNPIYLFYENVETDADGQKEKGTTYHRCWLGKRQTLRVTVGMNHSLNGLKGHIMRKFPAYYRLFEVLYREKREATPDELDIIRGKTLVSEGWANRYISDLESVNNNIHEMFEKQAAASLVRS
ncbi:hypothetical protein B0H14DRAFT_2580348 [Mycena olivaceomarginata]|nr:hypothetical protein B0H14DRAFT_2580348 [Mycena olivaceomarginata]